MKKSLSLVLAIAMVFSMFASVAFAAEGTTELTPQQQFDALKEKGIFTGYEDGSAGLDKNMTRAEFAVVLTKLYGLTEDASAANYTDLTGYNWAKGYIGAATKAGFMRGYGNGKFNPGGNITVEELTVVYVISSGLQPVAGADVAGASKWAAGYVQAALDAGIIKAQSSYTAPAKRELLVTATYTVYQQIEAKNKVGIVKVEATDAKELTVTLTKAVDTEKAKFDVKRDGSTVKVNEVKWSADKKTAVLTLDVKLTDATYTVTISGVDNIDDAKKTGEVKASDEKITKIEFLTASDTLPLSEDIKIEFQAVNQYGKKAALNSNDFRINISNDDIEDSFQAVSGESAFKIDTYVDADSDDENDLDVDTNDVVSITIIHENSGVQANKVFKIGDHPWVSKIELGDLKDEDGEKIDYVKAGKSDTDTETTYLDFTAYDQYGLKVTNEDVLNGSRGVTVVTSDNDLEPGIDDEDKPFVADVDGDGEADLALTSKEEKEMEVTVTAYAAGSTATKVVKVAALRAPATIEIPAFTGNLADGDTDKYIPIVVKDSKGDALTASEIADNADKFRGYATGPIDLADSVIQTSGDDKGKIHIANVDGTGSSRIEIYLKENPNVKATINVVAGKERRPESIVWNDALKDKVLTNANAAFKYGIKDQYGDNFDKNEVNADYKVEINLERVGNGPTDVEVRRDNAVVLNNATRTVSYDNFSNIHDKEYKFHAYTQTGSVKVIARLIEKDGNKEVYKLEKTVQVIDGKDNTDLTYSVKLDGLNADGTIMAAHKVYADSVTDATYDGNTTATEFATALPKVTKEVKVEAKQGSKTVAINERIISLSSSDEKVARTVVIGNKGYVVGWEEGTATITATFETATGSDTATMTVKVSNTPSQVQSIALEKTTRTYDLSDSGTLEGKKLWDDALAQKVTVKDQYNTEFVSEKNADQHLVTYKSLLKLEYSIKNVKWDGSDANPNDARISIDSNGVLHYSGGPAAGGREVKSFTVVITAPSGKTASFDVDVQP